MDENIDILIINEKQKRNNDTCRQIQLEIPREYDELSNEYLIRKESNLKKEPKRVIIIDL